MLYNKLLADEAGTSHDETMPMDISGPTSDCVMPGCKTRLGDEEIALHEFPEHFAQKDAWINFVKKVKGHTWSPDRTSKICSLHFCPDDVTVEEGGHRLREGAVPINKEFVEKTYSETQLCGALLAVQSGETVSAVLQRYGVRLAVFKEVIKLEDYTLRWSHNSVVTDMQEMDLKKSLLKVANIFYGLTALQMSDLVYEYVKIHNIKHIFNKENIRVTLQWVELFLKRNPDFAFQLKQISNSDKKVSSKRYKEMYLHKLKSLIKQYEFPLSRIYNLHTLSLTEIFADAMVLHVTERVLSDKTITVSCCINAIGNFIPPMVVSFSGCNLRSNKHSPSRSLYQTTENGKMTKDVFKNWLHRFISHSKPTENDPVMLILDNSDCHISIEIAEICHRSNVSLLVLPCTELCHMQPLDVTFFNRLKDICLKNWILFDNHDKDYLKLCFNCFVDVYYEEMKRKTCNPRISQTFHKLLSDITDQTKLTVLYNSPAQKSIAKLNKVKDKGDKLYEHQKQMTQWNNIKNEFRKKRKNKLIFFEQDKIKDFEIDVTNSCFKQVSVLNIKRRKKNKHIQTKKPFKDRNAVPRVPNIIRRQTQKRNPTYKQYELEYDIEGDSTKQDILQEHIVKKVEEDTLERTEKRGFSDHQALKLTAVTKQYAPKKRKTSNIIKELVSANSRQYLYNNKKRIIMTVAMVETSHIQEILTSIYDIPNNNKFALNAMPKNEATISNVLKFNRKQEMFLKKHILTLIDIFYSLTKNEFYEIIFEFTELNNMKLDYEANEVIYNWISAYLAKNPEIGKKIIEEHYSEETEGIEEIVKMYFKRLKSLVDEYCFQASRIYNVYELGTVVSFKEIKASDKLHTSGTNYNVTLCCCGNALGEFILPMLIYPYSPSDPPPLESDYRCYSSTDVWMTKDIFKKWLNHFVHLVKPSQQNPVLLVLDKDNSHISIQINEYCQRNGIILLVTPPVTSCPVQPLDVIFFKTLYKTYQQKLNNSLRDLKINNISYNNIIDILVKSYLVASVPFNVIQGFAYTGIMPLKYTTLINLRTHLKHISSNSTDEFTLDNDNLGPTYSLPGKCKLSKINIKSNQSEIDLIPSSTSISKTMLAITSFNDLNHGGNVKLFSLSEQEHVQYINSKITNDTNETCSEKIKSDFQSGNSPTSNFPQSKFKSELTKIEIIPEGKSEPNFDLNDTIMQSVKYDAITIKEEFEVKDENITIMDKEAQPEGISKTTNIAVFVCTKKGKSKSETFNVKNASLDNFSAQDQEDITCEYSSYLNTYVNK